VAEKLEPKENSVAVTLKAADGSLQEIEVDRVISAVGISANVEGLGLEALGVTLDRGHIVTDEWCKTNVDGIYAIGDVAGAPWLAHKASHEGVIAIEKIAGVEGVAPLRKDAIPGCTYCTPQIASVGLTEQQAIDAGHSVKVGRFPFQGNGKAIALGEPQGMIKTVFDAESGRLLGAHMVGAEVTELIQGYGIALSLKATAAQLAHVIFPHPTLSEMMHESVLDADNRVIHM
jgi:dihydrolipoamide dehydrogenase